MSSAQLAPGTAIETFTVSGVSRVRTGATTYDATDAEGQAVQVTVYGAECFPSALVLERSLRELRQLQTLTHGRIARVIGCGKLPGGGTWEAHAPLPASSLAEHLASGPLAEADALAIAAQIGDALIEAQKVGVIHRNLGADAVFPSPAGVVVTGFAVGAPQGGRSFGPLDTMAPEQVEGKVVDQRTLIYNLAAIVHHMLRGAPLFTGDAASVLAAHLSTEPGVDVPSSLRRGLAKDPRVRPMMLKQFVTEIAGGLGAAPAGGAPTSRGWTMFTTEAAPAPTPVTATTPAAAAPATPPAPGEGAKPSTRGWTMFMQAQDDGAPAPVASGAAAAPAPAVPTPAPAAAPAPVVPAAGAKPSTRGWTMFMQAQEDEAAPAAAAPPTASAPPTAAAPATPAAPPTPAPVPAAGAPVAPTAAGGSGPSSRGWTMFTTAEEPATVVAPTPSSPTVPLPAAAAPAPAAAAAPAAPGEGAKPSTRGWTMFTRDDEASSPAPASVPAASAPTPVEPMGEPEGAPPSSRGWTMFMEPGAAAAAAASAPAAPPTASSTPTPAATPVPEAEPVGGQRRGWTMFMEAPITSAAAAPFGPATPSETPTPPPEAEVASSDNRGWTVFGAPSPVPGPEPTPAPEPTRTVISTAAPQPVAHDASEGPMASGQVTADAAPDPAPGRGRTVVATGVPAVQGSVGGVTGRTVFPSAAPMPDTQYFRRGDIPAERTASRTTAVDVPAPAGRPPAEERDSGPRAGVPVPAEPNLPERSGGSKTAIIVVIGLVVVAAIVGIVATLT